MNQTLHTRNKIVQLCSCIAVYLIALLFAALSVATVLQTCRIDPANPYAEIVNYDNDLVLTNIALIGLTALGALLCLRKRVDLSRISTKFVVGVMLLVTTLISLSWIHLVQSVAGGDARILLDTARDAAQNNYRSFYSSYDYYGNYSYYLYYPFQLGYVFFAEILYRVFGAESSDILFQIPNVIALDCIYVGLVVLTKLLFNRRSVTNLTAIALTLCLQPMFMTTLTNGALLGLAFAVWSVCHTVRFMQTDRLQNAGIAVLLMAVSVLLKYNNMIVMTAVCIALLLHALDKKKLLALAMAALMIVCSVGLPRIVIKSYAARSDAELNTHITQTLYTYMGISDSAMAPGWYNGLAMETLRDSQMNVETANEIASAGIKTRLDYLSSSGQLGEFLKKKLLSQLNEPAFASIWVSQVRSHNIPEGEKLSPVVESVYTGGFSKLLDNWFNYYHMIVCFSFTAGMVWLILRRRLTPGSLILPVAVLGGVLYHMLYEGKSQYLLPYFLMMIPFAVYGLVESIRALSKKAAVLYQ